MVLCKKGDDITLFDGTRILIKFLGRPIRDVGTMAQPVVKLIQNQQILF